ncbi:hypothetical protein Tco_0733186, partial [Tanacetum coccineum]
DDDDGVAATVSGGEDGEVGVARVMESDLPDRIDRVMRIVFELERKCPPEKFSDGGSVAATAAGGGARMAARNTRERD